MTEDQKRMFEDNYKLMYFAMKGIFFHGATTDEILSVGSEALIAAVKTYEKSRGEFSTYAYRCIRNKYIEYAQKNNKANNNAEVSIYEDISTPYGSYMLGEIIQDPETNIEKTSEIREEYDKVVKIASEVLTEKEAEYLNILLESKNQSDAAKRMGISKQAFSKKMGKIRDKIKSKYFCENF